MNQLRTTGMALIILGAVVFSYEGFITYRTHDKVIDVGPVKVVAEKKHTINLPPTLGAVALIGGVTLILISVKKA